MANKIGIVLVLDGEKEFTAAVQTAQKKVKDLQTELSDTAEQLEGTSESAGIFGETLRFAKMLMDQFGISSEEVFSLIVQDTQEGLKKNVYYGLYLG